MVHAEQVQSGKGRVCVERLQVSFHLIGGRHVGVFAQSARCGRYYAEVFGPSGLRDTGPFARVIVIDACLLVCGYAKPGERCEPSMANQVSTLGRVMHLQWLEQQLKMPAHWKVRGARDVHVSRLRSRQCSRRGGGACVHALWCVYAFVRYFINR